MQHFPIILKRELYYPYDSKAVAVKILDDETLSYIPIQETSSFRLGMCFGRVRMVNQKSGQRKLRLYEHTTKIAASWKREYPGRFGQTLQMNCKMLEMKCSGFNQARLQGWMKDTV